MSHLDMAPLPTTHDRNLLSHLSIVLQPAADVAGGLGHHHHVVHDGQVHKRLQRRRQPDVAADGVLLRGGRS